MFSVESLFDALGRKILAMIINFNSTLNIYSCIFLHDRHDYLDGPSLNFSFPEGFWCCALLAIKTFFNICSKFYA